MYTSRQQSFPTVIKSSVAVRATGLASVKEPGFSLNSFKQLMLLRSAEHAFECKVVVAL